MKQLKPHQVDAESRMHNGCILVGGTGSGKTLTSLVYAFESVLGGETPVYPNHSFKKPKNDIPIYVITTPKKRDSLDWGKEAANIPVDLAKIDSWNNIHKYTTIKNAMFIFDETRVIGYGSWVKSFLKIVANNQWVLLSATPADTWMEMIPVFIANGFYKNKTQFVAEHVIFSRYSKYPKVDSYLGLSKLIRLRDSIFVKMYYQMPTEQIHKFIICEYDKNNYQFLMANRWNIYKNKPINDISELCFTLRMLVNSDPSRIKELDKIYEKHLKVIIFYNHNYELNILRNWCKNRNIIYSEWNGQKHEEIPINNSWVYLCQYTAAQEAWECIETDCTVFYSQTYSYKAMIQSAGRIDRMNTPFKNLYYYHLLSSAPIDLAIKNNLKVKKNFNESKFIGSFRPSQEKHTL